MLYARPDRERSLRRSLRGNVAPDLVRLSKMMTLITIAVIYLEFLFKFRLLMLLDKTHYTQFGQFYTMHTIEPTIKFRDVTD